MVCSFSIFLHSLNFGLLQTEIATQNAEGTGQWVKVSHIPRLRFGINYTFLILSVNNTLINKDTAILSDNNLSNCTMNTNDIELL